jgi:hypothetical protein
MGKGSTPEAKAYRNAKYRCTDPRVKNFADYGGRGIEFLPRLSNSLQISARVESALETIKPTAGDFKKEALIGRSTRTWRQSPPSPSDAVLQSEGLTPPPQSTFRNHVAW